jgi:hypothetical protein
MSSSRDAPMLQAIGQNDLHVLGRVLKQKPEPTLAGKRRALRLAARLDRVDMVRMLLGANVDEHGRALAGAEAIRARAGESAGLIVATLSASLKEVALLDCATQLVRAYIRARGSARGAELPDWLAVLSVLIAHNGTGACSAALEGIIEAIAMYDPPSDAPPAPPRGTIDL